MLRECIAAMHSAGQSPELATGTKLFCKPECYSSVRKAVERMEDSLRPYHVIVTSEFRPKVMEIVKAFPRALKVKCKEEAVIAKIGLSGKWIPVHQETLAAESCMPAPVNAQMPQNAKAKAGAEAKLGGVAVPDEPLALNSILPPFSAPAVDPALGFPVFLPNLPLLTEFDPALVMRLMQDMEQHQKMLNDAFFLSMQTSQISPDFALSAAQQQQ